MTARKRVAKKQAARQAPAAIDVIDGMLAAAQVVEVNGTPLTLTVPCAADIRNIVRRMVVHQPDDSADLSAEDVAAASLELAAAAVQACIPGLDEDRATRLVLISGGERGPLVPKALDLCGLGADVQQALAEDTDDLPS